MSCPFCQIAAGKVQATVVHGDELTVAFLDRCPIRPGHVQIIPRAHYPYFDDLPPAVASHIVVTGQQLAAAIKRVTGVTRVGFLFTGGDIAHAHAHLVPMHDKTDITSRRYIAEEALTFRSTPRADERELRDMAETLRQALRSE